MGNRTHYRKESSLRKTMKVKDESCAIPHSYFFYNRAKEHEDWVINKGMQRMRWLNMDINLRIAEALKEIEDRSR